MRGTAVLLAAAVPVLLAGCGGASADDVGAVAAAFEDPAADPVDRCSLLAPATRAAFESDEGAPCAEAIDEVPLPGGEVTSTEVWGGDAQVRIGDDVVFLTESGAGWLVTAAACEARGGAPYECELEGP